MGFEKRNLSQKKKGRGRCGGGDGTRFTDEKARKPRRACCFFSGFGLFTPFFFEFSGHWWRPCWPLSTLEAWRYLKCLFICYLNSECIWRAFHRVSLMAKEIYLLFFPCSRYLLCFFLSYFFSDFQSFWHEQRIFSFQVYHKLVVMFVSFESARSNRDLSQRQVSTLVLCHVRHWIFNEALGLRHVRISCGLASLESHMSLVHYKCTSLVSLGMKNAKKWKFTLLLLGPWVSVPDKH